MTRAALAAALALITFSPAALAQGANEGEAAYQARCARCHTVAEVLGYMKAHPEDAARAAWLDGKLARHHARDAALRAAIIAYLEEARAAAK